MFKLLKAYLKARGGEASSWAGISVLFVFLGGVTGWDLTGLGEAVATALPHLLTGDFVTTLLIVVPSILAIIKKEKGSPDAAPKERVQERPQQPRAPPQPPPRAAAPQPGPRSPAAGATDDLGLPRTP